jgi:hypothetical protein
MATLTLRRHWVHTAVLFVLVPLCLGFSAYGLTRLWYRTGPVVQVDELVDLGVLEESAQLTIQVEVRNVGASPLRLSQFQTSCPLCVFVGRETAKGFEPVEELTVEPGYSAKLSVQIGVVPARPGQTYEPQIWFATNDSRHPEVSVVFSGKIRGTIVCYPNEVVLGSVRAGTAVHQSIQVRDTGRGTPYRLAEARVTGTAPLEARVRQLGPSASDPDAARLGTLVAEVELVGAIPEGVEGEQQQRLELHEEGGGPPRVVPIRYTVPPAYEVVPVSVILPRMVNGMPDYTATLTVRLPIKPTSGAGVNVRELPPNFTLVKPPAYDHQEGGYTMTVRYDPPTGGSPAGPKPVIRIDVPVRSGTKTVEVPVSLWQP